MFTLNRKKHPVGTWGDNRKALIEIKQFSPVVAGKPILRLNQLKAFEKQQSCLQ